MNSDSWRHRWRWISIPITIMTVTWTAWILWKALPEIISILPNLESEWILITLIGCMISAYAGFEGFRLLFNNSCPGAYSRAALAHLFFTGQLMKHLPGRIWSIAYQSAAGQRASVSQWVGLTIIHMGLTIFFATGASISIIAWQHNWLTGIAAIALGALTYSIIWNRKITNAILDAAQKIPTKFIRKTILTIKPYATADIDLKAKVLIYFTTSWAIYFTAWASYGAAWPGLIAADGVLLCAYYTLAWLAGYLSFVSPSGLGVRELAFITLAHNFPADAVAGMVIFGRTILLIVDIALGITFAYFREKNE